jgi:hypothetical protein
VETPIESLPQGTLKEVPWNILEELKYDSAMVDKEEYERVWSHARKLFEQSFLISSVTTNPS